MTETRLPQRSQEKYCNVTTLHARLHEVAPHMFVRLNSKPSESGVARCDSHSFIFLYNFQPKSALIRRTGAALPPQIAVVVKKEAPVEKKNTADEMRLDQQEAQKMLIQSREAIRLQAQQAQFAKAALEKQQKKEREEDCKIWLCTVEERSWRACHCAPPPAMQLLQRAFSRAGWPRIAGQSPCRRHPPT